MSKNNNIDIDKIKNYLHQFGKERGWEKYKTPKNLCMALSVEVAELMEAFQWIDGEESTAIKNNEKLMQPIKEEMADVFSYLVQIADALEVDIEKVFWEKTKKNEQKYPSKSIN
jgi:dCTP diphosphatase